MSNSNLMENQLVIIYKEVEETENKIKGMAKKLAELNLENSKMKDSLTDLMNSKTNLNSLLISRKVQIKQEIKDKEMIFEKLKKAEAKLVKFGFSVSNLNSSDIFSKK